MARIVFEAGEIDQNFQIENGIHATLNEHPIASLEKSVIESFYDDGENSTLEKKCEQIANELDVKFSLNETLVVFRPIRRSKQRA